MSEAGFLTSLPERAVIEITGEEAKDFLQRVITQGPQGVEPGKALASALLTPQGKVIADLILFDNGQGGLFVDIPGAQAEDLLKRFKLYKLRARAGIGLRADLAVAQARGDEEEQDLAAVAHAIAPDPRQAAMGRRAIVNAGGPVDREAYDAARIAAGLPECGKDYGPAEVFSTDVNHDLVGAINYRKGCFVGQEVASRMHRKGGVRKRTIRLAADMVLEPGTPVSVGETPIGEISSARAGRALARVRIDRLKAGLEENNLPHADGVRLEVLEDLEAI